MFCYQCQETAKNQGCTLNGVCGKSDEVAKLQDLLIFVSKGISFWSLKIDTKSTLQKEIDSFIVKALFTTVTNVNFDKQRIYEMIQHGISILLQAKDEFYREYEEKHKKKYSGTIPECATWNSTGDIIEFIRKGEQVGVLSCKNEDIRSLRELLTYGIKGIAAYADHAWILGFENPDITHFLKKALISTTNDELSIDDLFNLVVESGKIAVDTMALLDQANTGTYGLPEITQVYTGTTEGPGILVSGHDLRDFDELLKQTEMTGVNVYTHGEMLPAGAYPAFKKYKHFIGNFGTSWYNQQKEFEDFNGPILFTTNCIQKPKDSYKDRVYTTGLAGWDGVKHIQDRENNKAKDFSSLIDHAKQCGSIKKREGKNIPIGFHHTQILALADKIIGAIKAGKIKNFVVMGGCDGRQKNREYYSDYAQALPHTSVILTAGCAKYRYNLLDLGDIDGIPRVIDAGQCNDSYSLAVVALKLAEVLGVNDINDLPITYNIAWYEQKAVCVLLALLYLGVKNIHLGPTLPAFLSPNVVNVLVEKFNIGPIGSVEDDIKQLA
ncbi:MAG: hydroxylamine reductase [Spirochaetales bacterium]|nr:hydroxylamine reductase [Spirochaetales bacterium]